MPQTNTGVRELGELTLRELARLHILNEALREVERWIVGHSVREQYGSESDSNTAGASHSARASTLPASALVVCVRLAAKRSNAADHSHAARLEAMAAASEIRVRLDAKEIALPEEGLFGLRPCALFRKLFAEFRGDWLQMLAVRALKVELTASAYREFEVA